MTGAPVPVLQLAMIALLLAAAVGFLDGATAAAPTVWTADFEAAKARAREERKDLLLDFTGSDWCPPCIRLAKEVLDRPEFTGEASKRFVLVVVDKPRDPAKQTAEEKRTSETLHASFAVNRWPTLYLADAEGRPYARLDEGELPADVAGWNAMLESRQELRAKRDAVIAEAAALEGVARARKLDEALRLGGPFLPTAPLAGWIDEVLRLDADGKAGLAPAWRGRRAADALEVELPDLGKAGRWKDIVERLETLLGGFELEPLVKQKALHWKGAAHVRSGQPDEARRDLEAAIAIDATTEFGKRSKELLARL